MKTPKNKGKRKSRLNNDFAMRAATRAGSVLFAPPPCAKGTATVKFFYNGQYQIIISAINPRCSSEKVFELPWVC